MKISFYTDIIVRGIKAILAHDNFIEKIKVVTLTGIALFCALLISYATVYFS